MPLRSQNSIVWGGSHWIFSHSLQTSPPATSIQLMLFKSRAVTSLADAILLFNHRPGPQRLLGRLAVVGLGRGGRGFGTARPSVCTGHRQLSPLDLFAHPSPPGCPIDAASAPDPPLQPVPKYPGSPAKPPDKRPGSAARCG